MSGDARGGNDILTAVGTTIFSTATPERHERRHPRRQRQPDRTGDFNRLFGDVYLHAGDARGGNDSLTATGDNNSLYGDAFKMYDNAAAATTG